VTLLNDGAVVHPKLLSTVF